MRLTVKFKADVFPVANSPMGISMIKEALKIADMGYFKKVYAGENGEGRKSSKNFTYSFYVNDYIKEGDFFVKSDGVYMTISTPDVVLGTHIYDGMMTLNEFKYKEFVLTKDFVKIEKESKIVDSAVVIKTLSPIVVSKAEGGYLTVTEVGFVDRLNYVTDIVLKNYRGYGLKEVLGVEPIKVKKLVVKQPLRNFIALTGKECQCIDASVGTFKLSGDVEDLNDIYKLGVGFRRSQGFGNIKVVQK